MDSAWIKEKESGEIKKHPKHLMNYHFATWAELRFHRNVNYIFKKLEGWNGHIHENLKQERQYYGRDDVVVDVENYERKTQISEEIFFSNASG